MKILMSGIVCATLLAGCDHVDTKLKIKNNKDYPIVTDLGGESERKWHIAYFSVGHKVLNPGELDSYSTLGKWEEVFENNPDTERLVVYVIPAKYVGSDSNQIKKMMMVYPINYDSLKKHNWTVDIN